MLVAPNTSRCCILPLRVGDERQRPEVRLAGQLVIELVEHEPDVLAPRQLTVERDLSETARQHATLHGADRVERGANFGSCD